MANDEKRLSILGHLTELRKRLTRGVIAVLITTIISFVFYKQIFDLLTYKSPLVRPILEKLTEKLGFFAMPDVSLVFIELTEMVGTVMKVCLAAGFILAMPYLTYELVMFVSPALTSREKRYIYVALPWVAAMFIIGVVFGYFILIPPATNFLLSFGAEIATPQIKIGNFIGLVIRLLLAIGLIFELPALTTFLARLGILSPGFLAKKRKVAFLLAFVAGAIITPTFDPINQSLVAVPLIILYEMSIWLARLVYPKKKEVLEPVPVPVTQDKG